MCKTSTGAVLFLGLAVGCSTSTPPEGKPFAVASNDGIDHELYRGLSLDDFLGKLPAGSVDSMDLDLQIKTPVFAVVKVPAQPGRDLTKVRFASTFKTKDGQTIEKQWEAAEGRTEGGTIGVFCLPATVTGGETKVIANEG
jgi:hypothetical protein